jgi:glyoxylase-like metal-dependent hydrolase (beta-lactamase superfamily II)
MLEIKTISLGGVNCYLLKSQSGYVLVDTGFASRRAGLEKWLEAEGCRPGDLKLIVLTHGDTDHAGNAAFLREKFGAKIAMHRGDVAMAEQGDMASNRKSRPDRVSPVFRLLMWLGPVLFPPGRFEKFRPEILVEDGQGLSGFGIDAEVVSIPGHSKGSIGVLTAGGDLFCGDLLANFGKPGFHMLIDDLTVARASVERLKKLGVKAVYPGHGKPFRMEQLKV